MIWITMFPLHTASLHQALRLTGFGSSHKVECSAVIGWYSTAGIGAFRSSMLVSCSLSPTSYGSPVIVFFDRGHPRFRNFYSTVLIDVDRVKSYMNILFDLANVPMGIMFNKLNLISKRLVSGIGGVLGNRAEGRFRSCWGEHRTSIVDLR